MYYTYCHKTNHNVETCRINGKEDPIPTISEVTTQHIKVERPVKYSCHICDDTRHKIIDCPKYNDMQNMFENKGVKPIDKQVVVEPKVSNPSVHIMDVNVAITRSKVTKNKCLRTWSQLKSFLLTRKRSTYYNNLLSKLFMRCK
jgi:hypothetical protein